MNKVKYQKASLFDAPEGSLIVHAVNCHGVWGSGIAKEFKNRYPEAHERYHSSCRTIYPIENLGGFLFVSDKSSWYEKLKWTRPHKVGCLFTSFGYGKNVDSPEEILINTTLAIHDMLKFNELSKTIYSNKFNSGLFGVPWEKTEFIINTLLERYPQIKWIVMDPDMEHEKK